jgi:hypothetical protein
LEDNHNASTLKPDVATATNMIKEGLGENETGITSVVELSDLTEETVTFKETTDGKLNMETTTPAEQINLTSFSIIDLYFLLAEIIHHHCQLLKCLKVNT